MERQFKIRLLLFVLSIGYPVNASHFRGALIQWRTLEDIVPGNAVNVEFTYRIGWRRSYSGGTRCDQSTIDSAGLTGIGGDLRCRIGCAGVRSVTTLNYYCTDFSTTEDWTVGERSFELSVPAVPLFEASFASGAWISLVTGGGNWEVRVKLNFNQTLSAGRRQNASPQTKMSPVLRLQQGCNHTITIPVEDMDGDDVRCRWAESSLAECAGVCKTFPSADLNERECTIKYHAAGRTGYYAVALQVEDFASPTDTEPMSSVPLQFLVYVYNSDESCYSKPDFDELTQEDGACVGVPPNTTYYSQLTAVAGGPGVAIVDITTQSPPGMIKSSLQQGQRPSSWYVNITWTPTPAQNGPNIFCYLASDTTQRTSDQRCITLLGGVTPPSVVSESVTPSSSVYPTHTSWKLAFDRPIYRPKRTAYFRVYSSDTEREIYNIDSSTSPNVTFADPEVSNEMTITTSLLPFVEKKEYYILLDDGIAIGPEFCGPESPRVGDSNFWKFKVKDVTPPKITFTMAPLVTAENSTVLWEFDEQASVVCALQGPDSTFPVSCSNQSYQGVRLAEGDYTLYIQASDLEGNSQQYQHRWHVDLTRPIVSFSLKPTPFDRHSDFVFHFQCVDYTTCTFICKLSNNITEGKYQPCNGNYRLTNLQEGLQRVSVQATDSVGNIGSPIEHSWIVDTQAPVIELPANASVTCGDPISPTVLGFPVTRDLYDPAPKVTFLDIAATKCQTFRNWKAVDKAGNSKTLIQVISFNNPSPPRVTGHTQLYVACGSVDNIYESEYIFSRGLLNVTHPCERDLNVTYQDSASIKGCGVDITRQWTIKDDCGGVVYFTQVIKVLKQSDPEAPEDGQVNVPLTQQLRWPQYPGSTTYKVYIWSDGEDEPENPVTVVSSRGYYQQNPYPPNTRLLWRVGYLVRGENGTREIPSPVWGMVTRALADLVLTDLQVPPTVFSGSEVSVQWTVENRGNLSTSASAQYWYDVVYIGKSSELTDAREAARVKQRRYVDPSDGYQAETKIQLLKTDIGNFYVFVRVDLFRSVEDYNFKDNLRQATAPIKVQLTPPPNLVVVSVYSLGSSFSGKSTTIRWSVGNTGIGITQTAEWADAVFLSKDDTLDVSDTLLDTVTHKGALISNGEYNAVAQVTMPNAIYGSFHIFIHTDYHNDVYEHIDETDNTKSLETQIILSPTPDLVVSELNVERDLQTGDIMMANFVVKNKGAGSPFEPWWTDSLTLTSVSTGRVYYSSDQTRTQPLAAGDSYSGSFTFRIPPIMESGSYNLSVYTDNRNRVFEFNSDDNNLFVQSVNIRQSLPDLQVVGGVISLREDAIATVLAYNVSVINRGTGGLFEVSWLDEIYLSHVPDANRALMSLVARHRRGVDVDAGKGYQITGTYPLPLAQQGMVYIYVATDVGNNVIEESDTNNMLEVSKISIPQRAGDLIITQAEVAPFKVVAGETIVVQWTDKNQGNLAVKGWHDSIYLRRGENDNQNSVLLLRVEVRRSLAPEEEIVNRHNVTLPREAAGDYSIVIITGQFSANQETNTKNNNYATGIKILTPATPDLKVEEVKHEMRENSRVLAVTVRVSNEGNSVLQPLSWWDKVTLSEGHSSDLEVASTETPATQTLLALQSYTLTHLLVVPHYLQGYFTLVVEVDFKNNVDELFGEDNNNWRTVSPIQIPRVPYPHLEVIIDGSNLDTALLSGDMLVVSYLVTNTEGANVALTSWTDGLYLYSRQGVTRREVIQNGLMVGNSLYNRDIKVGESISGEISSRVPYGVSDRLFVYVIVDINNRLGIPEGSLAGFLPIPLDVRPGPLADLSVNLAADNTNRLQSGQLYSISFITSNLGNSSAVGKWYDTVYLSDDPLVDPFDIKLKTIERLKDVGIGQSYTQNVEIFIPFDLAGSNYYLIAEVNVDKIVFETEHTNNYDIQIVSVQSAPAVDILTKDVTHSKTSVTYSDPVQFGWKIQNAGNVPFSGYKCDSVYLSPDDRWDIDDFAVSGPTCEGFTLAALTGTKTYRATAPVPKLTEGTYTTIVRTRNNARDHNLHNNVGTSATQLSIAPPEIAMNERKTLTMKENGDLVLKVKEVPPGVALLVTLVTTNARAYHQMYLKFSEPPKPYSYDATSTERLTLNQRVSVSFSRGTIYYLLVESISTTDRSYQLTLEVKEAKFELSTVSPPKVAPFGNGTLRLTGMLFGQRLQACIFFASDKRRSRCSVAISRVDSERAYATFSMEGAPLGKYNMRLTDVDSGKETNVENAFEVVQEVGGRLILELVPPAPLRAGQAAVVVANVYNTGYNDLLTPLLVVASSGNSELIRVDSESGVEPEQAITFLAMSAGQPGDVLTPRSSRQFAFRVLPKNGFVGTERLVITETPESQLTRFISEAREEAKPTNLNPAVWEVVYSNFLACTGERADSIKYRLREIGSVLNTYSTVAYSVPDILNHLLLIADGSLTPMKLFDYVDFRDQMSRGFPALMFRRVYPSSISVRRTQGLLGKGWIIPWLEIGVEKIKGGLLLTSSRREYAFYPKKNGQYYCAALPGHSINIENGYYVYEAGSLLFMLDLEDGFLRQILDIDDRESKLTVEYRDLFPIKMIHSEASSLEFHYNHVGINEIRLFDANGVLLKEGKYTYDSNDQLIEFVSGRQVVSYAYNNLGYLNEIVYPSGEIQRVEYNDLHWLSAVVTSDGSGTILSDTRLEQTCNGEITVTELPVDISSKFQFGIGGMLLAQRPSIGLPASYIRNPMSASATVKIGDDLFKEESYDAERGVLTHISANGDKLEFYIEDGQIVKTADNIGMTSVNTFKNGLVQSSTYIDGRSRQFTYNIDGLVSEVKLEDDSNLSFMYDGRRNIISKQTVRGKMQYAYDSLNRLTEVRSDEGVTKVEYTMSDLPSKVVYPDGTEVLYKYNQYLQRSEISTSGGYHVTYHYDSNRRLSYVANGLGTELVRFAFDEHGRVSQRILGNGMKTNYTYDDSSMRLKEMKVVKGDGSILTWFWYNYDTRGYRMSLDTNEGTYKYRYDTSGQLVHWETPTGQNEELTYDSRQNRITKTTSGKTVAYKVNSVNQYTEQGNYKTYKYDTLGNIVEEAEKRGRNVLSKMYSFDQEKHLRRFEDREVRCEYKYTVFGTLNKKTCTDGSNGEYVIDPFGPYGATVLVQKENDKERNVYHALEQGLIGMGSLGTTDIEYYLFNGEGSTLHVTDNMGQILSTYAYDPFGNQMAGPAKDSNTYLFMGKYGARKLNESSSLYLMGARVYNAELGRFMSSDPLGMIGSPTNPYLYGHNNPLSYHDPHGLFLLPIIAAGAFIGAVTGAAANAITQGINIAASGGSLSDFSWGDVGGAAVAGGITGLAITTGAALPAALGGGALATAGGFAVTGAGGYLGGFIGSATSDALNGRPFDVGAAKQNALINAVTAYLPWRMLGYRGKGASAFGSPFIRMNFRTAFDPREVTGGSIWRSLGLGNAIGIIPGLRPGSWIIPPWLDPNVPGECPIPWIQSLDPNDILGPIGYGESNFIPAGLSMDYVVRFENDANATAPAQKVSIRSLLDSDLDITTFRLGSFGFGDVEIKLEYNSPFHQELINASEQTGAFVYFQAGFDAVRGEATWLLQAIDAETGLPPADPRIGFLPPNNGTSGQGFVSFRIQHDEQIEHETRLDASASIVFDENPPIETPPIFHTIDKIAPNASFDLDPGVPSTGGVLVNLLTSDSGSGVRSTDVYVLDDSGQVNAIVEGTNQTVVLLPLKAGEEYKILLTSVDFVGNSAPLKMDDYRIVNFEVKCASNCSGNGICGHDGVCTCYDGFFGQDCSQLYKGIDPPVIDFSYDYGTEDQPITAHVSARLSNEDTASLVIQISNISPDAMFDKGSADGGKLTIMPNDFGILVIWPPKHFSGRINFTLSAIASKSGSTTSRTLFASIPIEPVADQPILSVDADCYSGVGLFSFTADSRLIDEDGSEYLTLTVGEEKINVGRNSIAVSAVGQRVTVNATATEMANGDTAVTSKEVIVRSCDATTTKKPTNGQAKFAAGYVSIIYVILVLVLSFITKLK